MKRENNSESSCPVSDEWDEFCFLDEIYKINDFIVD